MTTTVLHCRNEDLKEPIQTTTTCNTKSKLVDYTKQRRNDMGSCFSLFADNEYNENKHTSTTRTTKYQKELKYLTEEVLRVQTLLAREKLSCCSSGHDSDESDYVEFLLPPLRHASYRRTPIPRGLILETYKRRSQSSQCSSNNNNISSNEEVLESSNLVLQKRKRTRNCDRSSSLSSTKSSQSIISFILRDFISKWSCFCYFIKYSNWPFLFYCTLLFYG